MRFALAFNFVFARRAAPAEVRAAQVLAACDAEKTVRVVSSDFCALSAGSWLSTSDGGANRSHHIQHQRLHLTKSRTMHHASVFPSNLRDVQVIGQNVGIHYTGRCH